jgi:hypothetical protein
MKINMDIANYVTYKHAKFIMIFLYYGLHKYNKNR